MAARNSGWIGTALGIGAALVVVYLVYRWFANSGTAQAGSGYMPLTGGGASGGIAGYPNNAGLANPNAMGNPLGSLLSKLGGLFGGSSTPMVAGGGAGAQTMQQLQSQIEAIGGFNTNAINLPNLQDLGGASLATYEPNYNGTVGNGSFTLPFDPNAGNLNLNLGGGNPLDLGALSGNYGQMNAVDNGSGGYATVMTDPTSLDFSSLGG